MNTVSEFMKRGVSTGKDVDEENSIEQARLEGKFTKEALDEVYSSAAKPGVFTATLIPVIVVVVMWPHFDAVTLLVWLFLVSCVVVIRYLIAVRYESSEVTWESAKLWSDRMSLTALASALLWSSTPSLTAMESEVRAVSPR